MSKNFWIILALIIGALVAIFILSGGKAAAPTDNKYENGNVLEVKETDHASGAGNKKVVLIEYGDFQCPSCGAFFPIIEQVRKQFGDDITFVFRHFPLTSIHPNAQAAHRAVEAAGNQGRFEEMYQTLYQSQQEWTDSKNASTIFESYAQQIGLDMERYKKDVVSETVNARIGADLESGKKVGVSGTPTFFLNGEKIEEPPRDIEGFTKLINEAIAKASPQSETAPAASE